MTTNIIQQNKQETVILLTKKQKKKGKRNYRSINHSVTATT